MLNLFKKKSISTQTEDINLAATRILRDSQSRLTHINGCLHNLDNAGPHYDPKIIADQRESLTHKQNVLNAIIELLTNFTTDVEPNLLRTSHENFIQTVKDNPRYVDGLIRSRVLNLTNDVLKMAPSIESKLSQSTKSARNI